MIRCWRTRTVLWLGAIACLLLAWPREDPWNEVARSPSAGMDQSLIAERRESLQPFGGAEGFSAVVIRTKQRVRARSHATGAVGHSSSTWTESIGALKQETDPIRRSALVEELVASIVPLDFPEALAAAVSEREFTMVALRRWSALEPHVAAEWVSGNVEREFLEEALTQVALGWNQIDSTEAIAWARQLPNETERNQALRTIAYETTRSDPIEALRLAADLPADAARNEVLRHAAMEWAWHDGPGAAQWARQIADDTVREQILAAVAIAWSDDDPVSAATVAVQELSSGRTQADAVISIVQRCAQQQPELAAAWVNQFPGGELRDTALAILVNSGHSK